MIVRDQQMVNEGSRQRPAPEPTPDPRGFVLATLVGFHCCDRGEDEHPLQAYSAAAKGPDGEAGMERLLDGFFAAHSINIEAEPSPDALRAMQLLLDGVPPTPELLRRTIGCSPDQNRQ
jgi:hypothetical protein